MKVDLSKYDNKTLWSLIGDLSTITKMCPENKSVWLEFGGAIVRELDKRMSNDSELDD